MQLPIATGGPTGPGGGAHQLMGPMSQPRGTIATASHTLDHTYALNVRFLSQLYSGQLRVSCILLWGGTVAHRARIEYRVLHC